MRQGLSVAIVACSTAAAAIATVPTARAEEGDWLFRGGLIIVNPKESNLTRTLGGDLVVDTAASPALSTAYMLTEHVATELLLAWPFSHGIDLKQGGGAVTRVGDVEHFPPTLSLQWHFNPDGGFRPYVGVGINYTTFSDAGLRSAAGLPPGTDLELDDSFGVAGQAGIDMFLDDKWFLNVEVRWIDMDSDATVTLPDAGGASDIGTFELDPWMYGFSLGYRFGAARPSPAPADGAEPAPPPQ